MVQADGGALTWDAAALLVRQRDEPLGLTGGLAGSVVDRREPSTVGHEELSLLGQRIYQIACGSEQCTDADHLGLTRR